MFDTPLDGVRLLESGRRIEVGDAVTILDDGPADASFEPLSPREYKDEISRAAEDVLQSVEAALNTYEHVTCGLTGGKDSRLIYAAALNLGRVDQIKFSTTPRENDIEIATGLVKKYGGEYASFAPAGYQRNTLSTAWARRTSLYFGAYHHVHPRTLRTAIPDYHPRLLKMTGGGGGQYKPVFFDSTVREMGNPSYSDAALRTLLKEKRTKSIFPPLLADKVLPSLESTFEELKGQTLGDKLNDHYINFRNRFHFALSSTSLSRSVTDLQPLYSPHILRAARGLPYEERINGRVAVDLLSVMYGELASVEFGKPIDSNAFDSMYSLVRSKGGMPLTPQPELAYHPRVIGKRNPSRQPSVDIEEVMVTQTKANVEMLKHGRFSYLFTASVIKNIAWVCSRKAASLQRWSSLTDFLVTLDDLQ